ncbi:phosphoadenylyl-sulfate reductase [Pseudohoeflea suaedae]|uniref:Adenosine 5'-phosphosulfate reductase n=1 Tax=Pseudohoeflea suaedae TaxID=877384 RepID=A0A4R5PP13_9HYPH|nr:phosphoadenylyl-sulfate reductase [Pseudohoeflea suaedae]TDH38786.1 phosphoadenylyl-sulfate reductase [Pseudohoeflea suaedae]
MQNARDAAHSHKSRRHDEAHALAVELARVPLDERLRRAAELGRAVFTTSLGLEDQVLTAAIARSGAAIAVKTLETGRLFPETVELIGVTRQRYGIELEEVHPAEADVQAFVNAYGLNGFYESVEARHACCDARKMKPLAIALASADVWITGIRRGQSQNRADTPLAEYDPVRDLIKINPLADYDLETLKDLVAIEDIPVNPLHARGFPSIGCEPCTRAIKPGEPERAGRWWWENDEKRECGLHVPSAASPIKTEAGKAHTA